MGGFSPRPPKFEPCMCLHVCSRDSQVMCADCAHMYTCHHILQSTVHACPCAYVSKLHMVQSLGACLHLSLAQPVPGCACVWFVVSLPVPAAGVCHSLSICFFLSLFHLFLHPSAFYLPSLPLSGPARSLLTTGTEEAAFSHVHTPFFNCFFSHPHCCSPNFNTLKLPAVPGTQTWTSPTQYRCRC